MKRGKLNTVNKENEKWFLLILKNNRPLDGKTFQRILKVLKRFSELKYITLYEFEGASQIPGRFLQINEQILTEKIFTFDEIYNLLEEIALFDWVDFFSYKEFPADWQLPEEIGDYLPLIHKSEVFIRGVDDNFVFIYTQKEKIIDEIKKHYSETEILKIDQKKLSEFIIPY